MPHSDADLLVFLTEARKLAFAKLAGALRDAVIEPYERETRGVKTASELASVDKALFLHTTVP
jgi:hypothetical protein